VAVTVLKPHGDLDAKTYQELIAAAKGAWNGGARDMVLDLGDVHYLEQLGPGGDPHDRPLAARPGAA